MFMKMFAKKAHEPYCCVGLGGLVGQAGQAGLSALAWDNGNEVVLRLQARGIDYSNEHLVADDPNPRDRIWRISLSTGLTYCPFCGTEVRRLVRASPDHFRELAARHYNFADENPERPARGRKP